MNNRTDIRRREIRRGAAFSTFSWQFKITQQRIFFRYLCFNVSLVAKVVSLRSYNNLMYTILMYHDKGNGHNSRYAEFTHGISY